MLDTRSGNRPIGGVTRAGGEECGNNGRRGDSIGSSFQRSDESGGSRTGDPAQHGGRRHHRVAVVRADVLRRPLRRLLPAPLGPHRPVGRADARSSTCRSRASTASCSSSPRCGASSASGRPSAARRHAPASSGDIKGWGMREWYVLTYLFGAFFIAGQVMEYAELVHENVTLSSDAYGSVFYMATGFHGLHVTGGLIAFLLIIARTFTTRRYTHANATGAVVTSYYWHFVDVVWIALFATIYLPAPMTDRATDARRTLGTLHRPIDRPPPPWTTGPHRERLGRPPPTPRRDRGAAAARPARDRRRLLLLRPQGRQRGADGLRRRRPGRQEPLPRQLRDAATASTPRARSPGRRLVGVGAASVDFQVGTGRMPLAGPERAGARQNKVKFDEDADRRAGRLRRLPRRPARASPRRSGRRSSSRAPPRTTGRSPPAARSSASTAPCATTSPAPAAR